MKIGNTKNKKDNTKTTGNSEKVENSGAGDQLTNVLKKSMEVAGPLKTMGTTLQTGLTLPNGTLEIFV